MTNLVVLDPSSSSAVLSGTTGGIKRVDISAYSGADYISVSMPDYPATKINAAQSYLDLTSNPEGDFATGPTDSIPFSASSPSLPITDGDAELRLPIASFTSIDKSSVVGVRFRIQATANCTFRALRVRACSASWVYAPIDIDTLNTRLERPPSPDGSVNRVSDFPITNIPKEPVSFPVLYRTDDPPSPSDPRLMDGSFGISLFSGSMDQTNGVRFYFRENDAEVLSQGDLDGLTQAELEAPKRQPELSSSSGSSSWMRVRLNWTAASITAVAENSEGATFTRYGEAMAPRSYYLLLVELTGPVLRARVFPSNVVQEILDEPLLDTGTIYNHSVWWRRRGRVGIYPSLQDGDARILSIRPRAMNFGEVTTAQFNSLTPTEGAQLTVGSTSEKELVEWVAASPWGGTVTTDNTLSSPEGKVPYKVETIASRPMQGIATNLFRIDQLERTTIGFWLKFPPSALTAVGSGLDALLYGDLGLVAPIDIPTIETNDWQPVRIPIGANPTFQTGLYRLIIVQSIPAVSTTWYLSDLSIKTPVVEWYGRAQNDPWGMGGEWMPFEDTINKSGGGALFSERGRNLQIQARVFRSNAEIHEFAVTPMYSQLSRLVWEDDQVPMGAAPATHTISKTVFGRDVAFAADWAGHPNYFTSRIIAYIWTFGDNRELSDGVIEYGPVVNHTYRYPGTYDVTLTVLAKDRAQYIATTTVTVS